MRAGPYVAWVLGLLCGLSACGNKDEAKSPDPQASAGSASGGSAGSAATEPEAHSYEADDPKLQYMGRVDWTNPKAPKFASPGVQLKAKFVGTGATIKIGDENRYGNYKNYFDVLVDDAPAVKLTALKAQTDYVVAQDLPNGEHICRRVT